MKIKRVIKSSLLPHCDSMTQKNHLMMFKDITYTNYENYLKHINTFCRAKCRGGTLQWKRLETNVLFKAFNIKTDVYCTQILGFVPHREHSELPSIIYISLV